MALDLDAGGVQNESEFGGSQRPLPGRYHVAVKRADDSMEKSDKVVVEFEVLAGTTPGQERRTHTEWYAVTDKALPRLTRLALACGLLRPGERKGVDFAEAEGRQLVIEIEENDYTDKDGNEKKGVRVTWMGMWSLSNPDVADVPKNAAAAKLVGGNGNGNRNGQQATAPAAAPAAAGDDWAGIV